MIKFYRWLHLAFIFSTDAKTVPHLNIISLNTDYSQTCKLKYNFSRWGTSFFILKL